MNAGGIANDSSKSIGTASKPIGESLFIITDTFETQDKNKLLLTSFAGKPTVIGMVFTSCAYACPRLTSEMIEISEKLKADGSKVNFVLVTFDIEKDTPEKLKAFANQMGLDSNWTLLHGNETSVRTLSVMLNVQYEKDADGNFSHSNMISVLDKSGALYFQKSGLKEDQQETVNKLKEIL